MIFPLARYATYSAICPIESKETGIGPAPAWRTQVYAVEQIAAGLADDVHEYWVLKGRQEGITTESLKLVSFWLQRHSGLQGMMVAEKDSNRYYLRDLFRNMVKGLPSPWRRDLRPGADNANMLAFDNGSRLMFDHAEVRGTLGRSRGVNVLHGTEMGSWNDQEGIGALQASLATKHPQRLYIWEGTARGHTPFKDRYFSAAKAVTQRAIFIGPWLHPDYRIERSQAALWRAYGENPPTTEEALWMAEVERRYGVPVTREFLTFRRWQYEEKMDRNEAMLAQEFPVLPEEAFQAFGIKFVGEITLRRLREGADAAPAPAGYRYTWGRTFDASGDDTVRACDPEHATLTVWEEPSPEGVYVVACLPAYSSSPEAMDHVIQVWRAWPDVMEQVAEFGCVGSEVPFYQLTWAMIHLCGAYSLLVPPFLAICVDHSGKAVLEEYQRLERYGWGLSPHLRRRGSELLDWLGSIRQFMYHRADSFAANAALHWVMTGHRSELFHTFRDSLERGSMVVRSPALMDELAMLRQGGDDVDNDQIQGGGSQSDAAACCAAMANQHFLQFVVPEIENLLAPRNPDVPAPTNGTEMVMRGFMANLQRRAREMEEAKAP